MKKIFLALLMFSVTAYSQSTTSPNMGMPIPIPGVTPGPAWANNIDSSLLIIDQHNHSPGQGVQISPNGMNINTDLSFNSNNAIMLRTTRYSPQVSILSGASEVGQLYVVGNELYYNDVNGGNKVQITNNGSVNAGAGSISGLPSGTASASFAAGTFTWQAATNTAANMDFASAILRNSTASSKGLTLNPPAAMAADFSLTLPALPLATRIVALDSSGNFAANVTGDGTTIQFASPTISIVNGGVGTNQLANLAVTTAKLADGAVTTIKIADGAVTAAKLDSGTLAWHTQTFTASGSLTIAAGVNQIYVDVVGGGGGGGGGSSSGGTAVAAGAGGGGSGAMKNSALIAVTPAEVLTMSIGAGGTAGVLGTSVGTAGGAGGNTSLLRSAQTLLAAIGGLGGGPGTRTAGAGGTGGGNPTPGAGGTGAVGVLFTAQIGFGGQSGGNGGGANANGGAGSAGTGFYITGFAGGTGGVTSIVSNRGGGGGGGSSSYAAGGAGGPNATNGSPGSLGSGGGGGSADASGAVGGTGQIVVRYLGGP